MHQTLLTPPEACAYLRERYGVRRTVATLAKMRVTGSSMLFRRLGRSIYYAPPDLDSWAGAALGIVHTSTSDFGRAG